MRHPVAQKRINRDISLRVILFVEKPVAISFMLRIEYASGNIWGTSRL
jgi:hypothetical protein